MNNGEVIPHKPIKSNNSNELRCETLHSFDLRPSLEAAWEELCRNCRAEIFSTPRWGRVWCLFYQNGRPLLFLTFWKNESLVGVLPLIIDTPPFLGMDFRIAKPIAIESTVDYYVPTILPEFATECWSLALKILFKDNLCSALALHRTLLSPGSAEAIRTALHRHTRSVKLWHDRECDVCTEFQFPDGYAPYLETLSSDVKKDYRRRIKTLNKTYPSVVEIVDHPDQVADEFERFATRHKEQWQSRGMPGHFGDWPRSKEYNRALVDVFSKERQVAFIMLRTDDKVLASKYTYTYEGTSYWRLPARLTGKDWDRFGLGRLSHLTSVEQLTAKGIKRIEAGVGHYEHKLSFCGTERSLRSILLVAHNPSIFLRIRTFLLGAMALEIGYYRGWFLKLAPRLHYPRGQLLAMWRRSRL